MVDIAGLNPPQREAVLNFCGPSLILAGAGTGKTRVITMRIAYMIAKGIPPSEIVALSFTNKAAREMRERAAALVGPRIKEAFLGTFHSYCLYILRRFHREAGLERRFLLADTTDQLDMVRRALAEKGWQGMYRAEALHYQIGQCKNNLVGPEEVLDKPLAGFQDPAVLSEIYALYERHLRLNHLIDFDDCIFKVVRLLDERPEVLASLSEEHRYFMVDEFQDTNLAQLAVIERLAARHHHICVVGDDDQSIYSWRGALYETIERFEEMFPGTKLIKLEQNYRCTNVILDAANAVIKNNPKRKDKSLWSDRKDNLPVKLVTFESDRAEARWVAEKILSLLGAGRQAKDIAILYRANAQARLFETALREFNITYRTFGGQSFFDRKEVKDFLSYFRLVLNPKDRMAFFRAITSPARGVGAKTLELLDEQSKKHRLTPLELLAQGGFQEKGAGAKAAQGFGELLLDLAAMPRTAPADYAALADAIVRRSGLRDDVREKVDNPGSRERRLEIFASLTPWIEGMTADLLETNGTIDETHLFDVLALDRDQRDKKEEGKNSVSLMTIHAAKGLEFPAVFVVGLEEEQLPHKNSLEDPAGLCEERRLFYVAITRAKQELFLSHCLEKTVGNAKHWRTPSRFLKEIPPQCLDVVNAQLTGTEPTIEAARDQRKTATLGQLGQLRAWLTDKSTNR